MGEKQQCNGSNMEALSATAWCNSKLQKAVWRIICSREDALSWVDKENSASA